MGRKNFVSLKHGGKLDIVKSLTKGASIAENCLEFLQICVYIINIIIKY